MDFLPHIFCVLYDFPMTKKDTDWQDNILGIDAAKDTDNEFWLEELKDAEGDGCASCFI